MEPTVDILMHVIGWNEKGVIGFMDQGTFLNYCNVSDEKFEEIKKIFPYISEETRQNVNKYQEGKK